MDRAPPSNIREISIDNQIDNAPDMIRRLALEFQPHTPADIGMRTIRSNQVF
jgi:hypothetical protein